MIRDAAALFERGEKMQLQYNIRNTHRAIGTKIIIQDHPEVRHDRAAAGPPDGPAARLRRPVARRLRGAGAEAGSASATPTTMSARACRAPRSWCGRRRPRRCVWNENTIIGNTVLYGATAGELFAAGQAGERFAVRNSRRDGGDRGLRRQWLRIHDRRHGGDPRAGRRQFRRRLHRRHGLRLRPGGDLRAARQPRHAALAAARLPALGRRAEGPGGTPRARRRARASPPGC